MSKKFISHALIGFAALVLTMTLFIWTVDLRVLNADVLSGELRKAGVPLELRKLIPEIFTGDANELSKQELDDTRLKISEAVSNNYVDRKLSSVSQSIIEFIKEGEPDPVIDFIDFPEKLAIAGVDYDQEFKEKFAEPIQLNKNGDLNIIPKTYKVLSILKYAGLGLFALIMLVEWLVTEKGSKLRRASKVFFYSGISYLMYWVILILLPLAFGDKLHATVQAKYDVGSLIGSIVVAIQGLFYFYFLVFAAVCLFIALILYLLRKFMYSSKNNNIPRYN